MDECVSFEYISKHIQEAQILSLKSCVTLGKILIMSVFLNMKLGKILSSDMFDLKIFLKSLH